MLNSIKKRFSRGETSQQHLESVIYAEVYDSNPDNFRDACRDAARIRCEVLEETTGVSLQRIKGTTLDNGSLLGEEKILPGIEMKIGAATIPMGCAGPVKINGEYAQGDIYIPLATNEAALVAGVQRGIKAINMSGGVSVLVRDDGMHRAPALEAPNIFEARRFCREICDNRELTKELAQYVQDPFVRLDKIEPWQLGRKVYLRLKCKTGDAMGMNGVTKASADITRALLDRLEGWRLVTISSNLCCDKKSAHVNVLCGRGKSVESEVFLPEEVLQTVFKTGVTSRSVEKLVYNKCYLGSALAGTIGGFNINAANVLAAIFAATGQDLAQVVESSSCFIQADAVEGGLNFTVSLPCLEVATHGGGTMFGTAREALELMGCGGRGNSVDDNTAVMRLAEITAAAVTALDLNTACAQAAGYEMADSHVRLARGEDA
jgi:hydroxymethylglutaryl-CoA reductase (NADPH)